MITSESIKELSAALCKAQAVMAGAKKDRENPHFKSKFADLSSVWEACRKALTDNGIAVVQMTKASDKDEVLVVTRLCHSSGEWMEGELALPVSKQDAQGFGSALTYARRYSLAAAVGVAPEDDDGNAAAAAKPEARPISGKQVAVDAFDALDPETKKFLQERAVEVIAVHEDGGDLHSYFLRNHFDTEEKLALWSLLPSPVRSAIKAQQKAAAEKRTN